MKIAFLFIINKKLIKIKQYIVQFALVFFKTSLLILNDDIHTNYY